MDEYDRTIVTAELEPGAPTILVEVQTPDPETDVGIADAFAFKRLTESLEAITNSMSAAIEKAKPDRAAVEFGVDVALESSGLTALIAKGTGGATLKVTLEWNGEGRD